MLKKILPTGLLLALSLGGLGTYWFFVRHWDADRKTAEARETLAFESLETRIPKGKPIVLSGSLSPDAARRWDEIEKRIDQSFLPRAKLLKELHERTRRFFVESPSAGSERGIFRDEDFLLIERPGSFKQQPGLAADFPISAGETLRTVKPDRDHFLGHEDAAFLFLNPAGFGYVKDRANVAGFHPHGFRHWRDSFEKPLKIDHVLLVGILMHDQPVVYLTDQLPSMEQIRQSKTRPLDLFEQAGLEALRGGEDLYIVRKDETLRMFGALRATKQCLKCHDAARGDLLGAFSYTLRPKAGQ